MAGVNLQTLKTDLMRLVLSGLQQSGSSAELTEDQIFRLLNEAQRDVQVRLQLNKAVGTNKSAPLTLTSGTWQYDLPVDLVGSRIREIRLKDTQGVWNRLARLDVVDMRRLYTIGADTPEASGEPVHWAVDEETREFLLAPVPDRTAASSLTLTYDREPTPLHRLYHSSTGSSVSSAGTFGSAAITVTGSVDANAIQSGDEFGVVPTTQSDGATASNSNPLRWYRVLTWSTPTITLAETFAELAVSGVAFITAQVDDIEAQIPSKLGMALAIYAAGLYFRGTAPEMAAGFLGEAISLIDSVTRDQSGIHLTKGRPGRTSVFGRGW